MKRLMGSAPCPLMYGHLRGQSSQAWASGIPDTHAGNSKLLSCICHHCKCGILLLEQGMVAVCAGQ